MNEPLARFNISLYQSNPDMFTDEQVQQLESVSYSLGIPFQRRHEADDSNLRNTAANLFAGFAEGLTTLPVGEWLRVEPKNAVDNIAYSVGSLMGFVGAIPGPGLLGKLGVGKLLKGMKFGTAAEVLEKLPTAIRFKSVPMYIADKTMGMLNKTGFKSAMEASKFLADKPVVRDLIEGAVHLGVASGVGAAPIYDLTPQTFIDQRLEGIAHGALYGIGNRLIGNIFSRGGKMDLGAQYVKMTPQQIKTLSLTDPAKAAELLKSADKVNTIARAVSSSLFFGMPATMRDLPIELQVYEYLINAYFGAKEMSWHQKKALEIATPLARDSQTRNLLLSPEKLPNYDKLPKEVQDELQMNAEFEFGGKLGRFSKSEYALYGSINDALLEIENKHKAGQMTAQEYQDAKDGLRISQLVQENIAKFGEEEGTEKGLKQAKEELVKQAEERFANFRHNQALSSLIQDLSTLSAKMAENNFAVKYGQQLNDFETLYKEKGLSYYRYTFDKIAEEAAKTAGIETGKSLDWQFDAQRKIIDVASDFLAKDKIMDNAQFKNRIKDVLGYDVTGNKDIDKKLDNAYFKLKNSVPRFELMLDESGKVIEPSEERTSGLKRVVTYEPRPVIDSPAFLNGSLREIKNVVRGDTEVPVQKLVEEGELSIIDVIHNIYDQNRAFYGGKKADSNLITGNFLVEKESVPAILESLAAANPTVKGKVFSEEFTQAKERFVKQGGRAEVFDHLTANNIELFRRFNFPHIASHAEALSRMSEGNFILDPVAFNKRMQVFSAFESRIDVNDLKAVAPDLPDEMKFIILNANNKDSSFHGLFDSDFIYKAYGKDDKGNKIVQDKKFKEFLDGGVFVSQKTYDAFMKVAGLDELSGSAKGTQFAQGREDNLGGFVGKYAYHRADDAMNKWMDEQGVNMIHFDTTAKQRGARKSMDWAFDKTIKIKTGQTMPKGKKVSQKGSNAEIDYIYSLPWDSLSLTLSEDSGKLNKGTTIAKQVGDNIGDFDAQKEYTKWTTQQALEGTDRGRNLYRQYIAADEAGRAKIAEAIDIDEIGVENIIQILKGDKGNRLYEKILKDVVNTSEDVEEYKEAMYDGVLDEESSGLVKDLLRQQGAANKILNAVDINIQTMQIPGMKEYWNTALTRWLFKRVITPKTKYGAKVVLRPHSPFHFGDEPFQKGHYYLGESMREQRVKDIDGTDSTLGALWDKYGKQIKDIQKKTELTAEEQKIKKHFTHLLARTPADSRAGVRTLTFGGFLKGQRGYGIALHPEDMMNMGGADTDIDTSFIYFDAPEGLRDYYSKHQNQWNPEGIYTESKTATQEFMTKNQPELHLFDPYSQFEINTVAYNGNMLLGPALSYANRLKAFVRYAEQKNYKKMQGFAQTDAFQQMEESQFIAMVNEEYRKSKLPVNTDGTPRSTQTKEYKSVVDRVRRKLESIKKSTDIVQWEGRIDYEGVAKLEQLAREVINFAADSADGIRVKSPREIKKLLLSTVLKDTRRSKRTGKDTFALEPVAVDESITGTDKISGRTFTFDAVNENRNPVIAEMTLLDNLIKNRNWDIRKPDGNPGRFNLDQITSILTEHRMRYSDSLPATSYMAIHELGKYSFRGINDGWRAPDDVSLKFMEVFDKVFYEDKEGKSPYAELLNKAMGRGLRTNAGKRSEVIRKWEEKNAYKQGKYGTQYYQALVRNVSDEFIRNDMLDTVSALYVIDKYNALTGYKDTDNLGFREHKGIDGYKVSEANRIKKFVSIYKNLVDNILENKRNDVKVFDHIYIDFETGKVKYDPSREYHLSLEVLDAFAKEFYTAKSQMDPALIQAAQAEKIAIDNRDLYPAEKEYFEALMIANLRPQYKAYEENTGKLRDAFEKMAIEAKRAYGIPMQAKNFSVPDMLRKMLATAEGDAFLKLQEDIEKLDTAKKAYSNSANQWYESNASATWLNKEFVSGKTVAEYSKMFENIAKATFNGVPEVFKQVSEKPDELVENFSADVENEVLRANDTVKKIQSLIPEYVSALAEQKKDNIRFPMTKEMESVTNTLKGILVKHPYLISNLPDRFIAWSSYISGVPKDWTELTLPELKGFVETLKELDTLDPKGYPVKKRHYFFKPEWIADIHDKYDMKTSAPMNMPVFNAKTDKIIYRELQVPMSYMRQHVELSHQFQRNIEEAIDEVSDNLNVSPLMNLMDSIKDSKFANLAYEMAQAEREVQRSMYNAEVEKVSKFNPDAPSVEKTAYLYAMKDGFDLETLRKRKDMIEVPLHKLIMNDDKVQENNTVLREFFDNLQRENIKYVIPEDMFGNNALKLLKEKAPKTHDYLTQWLKELDGDALMRKYRATRARALKEKAYEQKFTVVLPSGKEKGTTKVYTFQQVVDMMKSGSDSLFSDMWTKFVLGTEKDFDNYLMDILGRYSAKGKNMIQDDYPNWVHYEEVMEDMSKSAFNKKKLENRGINISEFLNFQYNLDHTKFLDPMKNAEGKKEWKKGIDFKNFQERIEFYKRVWDDARLVNKLDEEGRPEFDSMGAPVKELEFTNRAKMKYSPYTKMNSEDVYDEFTGQLKFTGKDLHKSYYPHMNHPEAAVKRALQFRIDSEPDPQKRAKLIVEANRMLNNDADLSQATEDILMKREGGVTDERFEISRGMRSRNLMARSTKGMIEGWTYNPSDIANYAQSLVKQYYQGLEAMLLHYNADKMYDAIISGKNALGKENAKYWKQFIQGSIRNILGYPANYPAEWLTDPKYKIKGNPYHLVTENYYANKATVLDKFFGITEKMRKEQTLMVPKTLADFKDEVKEKFGSKVAELHNIYAQRDILAKREREEGRNFNNSISKLSSELIEKRNKYGFKTPEELRSKLKEVNDYLNTLSQDKWIKPKVQRDPVLDEEGKLVIKDGKPVFTETEITADVYKGVRESLVSKKLASLSNLEGKWNLLTLLAHPKTALANLLSSYQNTISSVGFGYFMQAMRLSDLKRINPAWTSKAQIEADIDRVGGIENYFKYEMSYSQKFTSENAKRFMERVTAKIKENPDLEDATIYEIAKQEGITKAFVDKGAYFIKKSERAARRTAWLAHYLKAREVFDATPGWQWDDPWLVQMANRGVAATQFLYHNAARPEFMRTALGKVVGRFQMFALSSIEMRRQIAKQASIMGYAPKTEQYAKLERMLTTDMFMLALASVLPFSIFNTTLPPPMSYLQDFAQYLFGSEEEKERAFFGILPYPLNIVQPVLPPSSRIITSTLNMLLSGDVEKFASYQMWTFFPFGRVFNDVRKSLESPQFFSERVLGLPYNTLIREIDRSNKIQSKREGE